VDKCKRVVKACGLLHGLVVKRRSLAGVLSLSCTRPAADGWLLMWVSHLLQASQPGQLSLLSFHGRYMSSKQYSDVRYLTWGNVVWRTLMGWRPGVVDWDAGVLAGCSRGSNVRYCGQRIDRISLQHHCLLPINCHFWHCKACCSGPTM